MRLRLTILAALLLSAGMVLAGQPGKRKPDPERGHDYWSQSCWFCHGKDAEGDGPSAATMTNPVPNLRGTITRDRFPDLIEVIQEGRGAMPGFAATIDRHDSRRILVFLENLDDTAEPEDDAAPPEEDAAEPEDDAPVKDGGAEPE